MFVSRPTKSVVSPLLLCGLVLAAGCSVEKKSLLAPSGAVLTLSADQPYVATNGSSTIRVSGQNVDGSPAAEGTEVVLSCTLGQFDQRKLRLKGGQATATFQSGGATGVAVITAASGSITAEITVRVGSAPAGNVSVATSPPVLPPGGGQTDVIATVTSPSGGFVAGAPVKFSTSAGTLAASEATTNERGEARTTLQTSTSATVTASVLNLQAVTAVSVRSQLTIGVFTSPAEPVAGQAATLSATIRSADGQATSGRFRFITGDGQVKDVGMVSGAATASHTWATAGGYNLSGEFTDQDGSVTRETIRVNVRAATSTPSPTPTPTPTPTPPVSGGGPRTPDPAPGQRLPLPNMAWVVEEVARQYPGALRNSCQEHGGTWEFIDRVVDRLRQHDTRWGYNCKRGNCNDPSLDVVDYNYGSGGDEGTTNVYIIDIMGGHCGSNPSPAWIDQTQATANGGTIGRWTSRGRF